MPLQDSQILDRTHSATERPDLADAQAVLLKRAALLKPQDRTLLELAIRNHASHRQLGRVLQMPAGTVTRRLRRLINRLHEPIVLALLEPKLTLPDEYRQLGIEYFLQGQTVRELADLHQISRSETRRMIEYVRGWYRGVGRPLRRW